MLGAILRILTGGVLDRVLSTVDRKIAAETDREALKAEIIREHYRTRDLLTVDRQDKTMVRRGTIREVERFQAAIKKLFDRVAATSILSLKPQPPRPTP